MNKNTIIELTEFGILPNTNIDYTKQLNKIFNNSESNITYRFSPGTYCFFAKNGEKSEYAMSNTEPIPKRTLSIWIKDKQNITIEGNGAEFIYYGHVQPITLDNCKNIQLKNFTIDWEKPLVAEGTIVAKTSDYLDVCINQQLFPCYVHNFCLYFDIGDGETSQLTYGAHTIYKSATLTVAQNSADIIMIKNAEHIGNDIFRLYTSGILKENQSPSVNDILVLRHNQRHHAGIFAEHCSNLIYNNIKIHSCGGIGMLFQFCSDVTCQNLSFIPNNKIGRKISCTRDDGMQISNCRGHFITEGCTFHGLQDSPINIHGTSVYVKKFITNRIIECKYINKYAHGFKYLAEPGDELKFLNRNNMSEIERATVLSCHATKNGHFVLEFTEPISENLIKMQTKEIAIENMTNSPSVTIRYNHFGSCRSRGILVTTLKPVIIEENYFESAGSAILISGDVNFWNEVGSCRNVIIRRNIFTDACNIAPYEYCYAMITIYPVIPKPQKNINYHSNILIEDNTFSSPDTPILYAFSVKNLTVRQNKVFRSNRFINHNTEKSLFHIKNCDETILTDNILIGTFSLNENKTENCTLIERTK